MQNDHITLERFDDYHMGWEGPHFDEVVFRIVTENATRRSLVEAGEADATTQNLTPKDVTSVESAGKLAVLKYDSTAVYWTAMNGFTIPDPTVRQGFAYAFPYEEVRTGVYEGLIEETSGPCTPTTRGYDKNGFIYKTDLDKAKQILTDAGWDFRRNSPTRWNRRAKRSQASHSSSRPICSRLASRWTSTRWRPARRPTWTMVQRPATSGPISSLELVARLQ